MRALLPAARADRCSLLALLGARRLRHRRGARRGALPARHGAARRRATPTGRWSSSATSSASNGEHIPARLAYAGVAARARRDPRGDRPVPARGRAGPGQPRGAARGDRARAARCRTSPPPRSTPPRPSPSRPADPEIRALKATVDFRHPATRAAAVEMAAAVVAEAPGIVRGADGADRRPAQRRRAARGAAADRRGAGAGPRRPGPAPGAPRRARGSSATPPAPAPSSQRMAELFPDDAGVRQALIQWHLRARRPRRRRGGAARRRRAHARDDPQPALTLVQFLLEIRGPEAARAELEARIAAAADPAPVPAGAGRARLRRKAAARPGDRRAARSCSTAPSPPTPPATCRSALAEMLAETGDAAESASARRRPCSPATRTTSRR